MRPASALIALFALASSASQAAPLPRTPATPATRAPLGDVERSALVDWNTRRSKASSHEEPWTLSTPPLGKVLPAARAAQQQVEQIVTRLAGDSLRTRGIHLIVNIYRSQAREIRHAQHELEDEPELRALLKAPDAIKTVYELQVPTGALEGITTKEELAFGVARNLAVVLDGGTATLSGAQKDDLVADKGAFDLMAGKYDLEGGLKSIEQLAGRGVDAKGTLVAGAQSHLHDGARIGAALAYVEHLRSTRTDLAASRQMKLDLASLRPAHARPAEPAYKDQLSLLLNTEHPWYPGDFTTGPEDATTLAHMLVALADRLDQQKKVSSKMKTFAFLRSMLENERVDYDQFGALDNQQIDRLARFLVQNGAGPRGGKPQDFVDKARELGKPDVIVRSFLHHPRGQMLFQRVAHASHDWRAFIESIPAQVSDFDLKSGRTLAFWELGDYLGSLEHNFYAGPMDAELKQQALDYIKQLPWDKLVRQIDSGRVNYLEQMAFHYPEFMTLLEHLENPRDHAKSVDAPFHDAVRAALEPARHAFAQYRRVTLDETLKTLAQPKIADREFFQHLTRATHFLESEDHVAFDGKEIDELAPRLLRLITEVNRRRDPERRARTMMGLTGESPLTQRILTDLLERGDVAREDKKQIVRYLQPPSRKYRIEMSAEQMARIGAFLGTLSHKELVELHAQDSAWVPGERDEGALMRNSRLLSFAAMEPAAGKAQASAFTFAELSTLLRGDRDRAAGVKKGARTDSELEKFATHSAAGALLASLREEHGPSQALAVTRPAREGASYDRLAATFLLETLIATQAHAPNLDAWYEAFHQIRHDNELALDGRPTFRADLERYLVGALGKLAPQNALKWLARPDIISLLSNDALAEILVRGVQGRAAGTSLADAVRGVRARYKLPTERPGADRRLQELIAEREHLQPGDLKTVFPRGEGSVVDATESWGKNARALSAVIAETHQQPVGDQLHFLDYMMGRRDDAPAFVHSSSAMIDETPLVNRAAHVRQELAHEDVPARLLFVNSFLAGPGGFLAKPGKPGEPGGRQQLLDHLLKDVSAPSQKFARAIAEAALDAEGRFQSLGLAYVLAQPAKHGAGATPEGREAELLKSLFLAYGVPGIKLAQYLAFSADFSAYQKAFSSLQDSAMPLNHLEALELLEHRFGASWPGRYEVKRVLGTGSVNVAIEYVDHESGREEVVSVGRRDIQASAAHNFDRLRNFIDRFLQAPKMAASYGYLHGLLGVIEASVSLEFDRDNAFKVQNGAVPLYRRKLKGWNVQTLNAYQVRDGALFMEKGYGDTARRVAERSPAVYRSALKALSEVEFDALLGVDQSGNPQPVWLHANPDFHDGQVLIDERTHTVTILDFGQALQLTNAERDAGIDLLRIVSGLSFSQAAAERLARLFPRAADAKGAPIDAEGVKKALSGPDRMDKFIRLLSRLQEGGHHVPLAVVHWVLAMDRQIVLGDRIGVRREAQVRNLVLSNATHMDLTNYNRLRQLSAHIKGD